MVRKSEEWEQNSLPFSNKSVHSVDDILFLFSHFYEIPFNTAHFCVHNQEIKVCNIWIEIFKIIGLAPMVFEIIETKQFMHP